MAVTTAAQRRAVAAARQARQELGAGIEGPLTDVVTLIEGPGEIPITIAELSDRLSGALLVERGRPFIILNGRDHPVRQRFTLAHEFGHWTLGHGQVVDGPGSFTARSTHPDEFQANYFASEFLAPAPAVSAWMEARGEPEVTLEIVVGLAVTFGISAKAARIRLEAARYLPTVKQRSDLDALINAGEHRTLMFRLGLQELNDTITSAKDHLPRVPQALRSKALAGFQNGLLDVERLAGMLRRPVEQTARELAEHGVTQAQLDDEDPDW
jgi:Zn-dependent peptidase ImmA (M78 family)